MKFKYIEHDPMDQMPAPVGKMVLTMLGFTAIMVSYLLFWSLIMGGL